MNFKISGLALCVSAMALGAACSSTPGDSGFAPSSSSSGGSNSSGSSGGSSGGSGSGSSSGNNTGDGSIIGSSGSSSGGGMSCNVTNMNADMDMDGWSPAQGDCNDCDPNVNPGAIDTLHTPGDGGAPYWGNEDCSGMPGDNAKPCDTGLALDDLMPGDAAKAMELCATATTSDKKYGVLSAQYVHVDGTPFATPGAQVGLQTAWGTNVKPQGGQSMFAMSSGYARDPSQPNNCSLVNASKGASSFKSCQIGTAASNPPTGFPQDDPVCPKTPSIWDDVALELQIRAPTNATGYSFNFKFYSFEFPDWVCDQSGYNDQFVALVNPPPMGAYVPSGSMFGNISFDSNNHPVSVNMGFFDACDSSSPTRFASHCKSTSGATCPPTPSPYCPLGVGDLAGTGFDVWLSTGPAGATRWLKTTAPVKGGSTVTIRFAMWDAGNGQFDSTTLVDNFQWIANGGNLPVPVGTQPAQ